MSKKPNIKKIIDERPHLEEAFSYLKSNVEQLSQDSNLLSHILSYIDTLENIVLEIEDNKLWLLEAVNNEKKGRLTCPFCKSELFSKAVDTTTYSRHECSNCPAVVYR